MTHNQWIWNKNAPATNCYVDFALDLEIQALPANAQIDISADTEYVLWVNGEFAGCGQYYSFPQNRIYDTLSLTSYLTEGKNRIAITVYYQGEESSNYAIGDAGLWFLLTADGETIAQSDKYIYSAPSVTYQPGAHCVTGQYGFGFVYDATKEDDWKKPEVSLPARFTPSHSYDSFIPAPRPTEKCVIQPLHNGKLCSQGIFIRTKEDKNPAIAVYHDAISYRSSWEIFNNAAPLTPIADNNIFAVFDLGREISGFVTLTLEAEENTMIDIAWGEHLEANGVAAYIAGRSFANRYYAKPGKQTFTYYFRRIAGRYLQLHIVGKVKAIETVGIYESLYPVQLLPLPSAGDRLMDKILSVSRETLKQCMHEHYEDCPWREQSMYAGDSRNQMVCGYYAFGEFKFARACLDLLGQSMRENGFLAICAPTDNILQIPSFTFLWILSMAEYAKYSGDLTLAKKYFPVILSTLRRCTKELPEGIAIHPFGKGIWNFYEWSQGCDGGDIYTPADSMNYAAGHKDGLYQMFLYAALNSAATIAKALEETEIRAELINIMSTLKQGIHSVFWNEEKQRFASFSDNGKQNHYCQLMQAMALFNNIADVHTATLCDALMNDNELVGITLSYTIYLYEGLLMQGDAYKTFVLEDIIKKWGKMLYAGATTFWETELGAADFGGAGSLCHGWSAVPLYIYCRFFQGITPEDLKKL